MIAKHIPMTHAEKSSMLRLVNYIMDSQDKENRVGQVFISNCLSDSPDMAAYEMLATQEGNTRSEADKTYHAIVSFPVGEIPPPEVLEEIEEAICDTLKMGDHQRVAVVHYDTSCVHMHIALNKIHPVTHTIREPFQDHIVLGKLSEQLERKYGLERTNHTPSGKSRGEREAQDIEKMTGQQSLLSWIRGECLNDLRQADSWEKMHAIAVSFGLSVKLRGNGLVFANTDGATVKGSDVGAEFKKSSLEKRLGSFQSPTNSPAIPIPERVYDKKPLSGTKALKQEFEAYRSSAAIARKARYGAVKDEFNQKAARILEMNKKDRLQVRRLPVGRIRKRAMYKAIYERYQREMRLLRREAKSRRDAIRKDIPSVSWLPWLQGQAMAGREDAIKTLRSRGYALAKKRGADIGGDVDSPHSLVNVPGAKVDAITKQGIVIYSVGADAIRDDGHAFRLSRNATTDTDIMALKMAMQRYGRKLRIHGEMKFQERMVNAAVKNRLYVSFADPNMESRRRMMMIATPQKSKVTTQERI